MGWAPPRPTTKHHPGITRHHPGNLQAAPGGLAEVGTTRRKPPRALPSTTRGNHQAPPGMALSLPRVSQPGIGRHKRKHLELNMHTENEQEKRKEIPRRTEPSQTHKPRNAPKNKNWWQTKSRKEKKETVVFMF